MPLLNRKRGNKSVLSQKDSKSVDGTQSSESCPMDVKSLLFSVNITLNDDVYCCPNVFDSLCELRKIITTEDQAHSIIKDLESNYSSNQDFIPFLKPISEKKDNGDDVSLSSFGKDSVCRLLLRVQPMQTDMLSFLLSKITEHSDEDCEPGSIINYLLSQFRWLDFVSDCNALVMGLLDLLSICSKSVQREIMNLLPEIVHDSLQETCVRELITFLQTDSSLCPVIFSTLENLRLSEKQFLDNLSCFTEALTTVSLIDLGKVIRFLLCSCPLPAMIKNNSECVNVLKLVRQACDIPKWIDSPDHKEVGDSIFEELFSCFQQKHELSKVYVKVLSLLSIDELLSIDIWICAILLKENLQSFQIERLFSQRCTHMSNQSSIFHMAIHSNGISIQPIFKQLLQIAEIMSRTSSSVTQGFASDVFVSCWNEYKYPFYQQEIISSLVTMIGAASISYQTSSSSSLTASSAHEVGVALMTLQRLAEDENNEEDLKKYLIFIRGILDYSDRLSISHTRILLGILCKLASTAREEDSSSMNELFILVRKYLGMNDITHRRMGVLGCCSIMQYYRGDTESIHNIFSFCLKSSRNFPDIRLFFYQQLIVCIQQQSLSQELVSFIKEEMASILDSNYIDDIDENEEEVNTLRNGSLHPVMEYDLQDHKAKIGINLIKFCSASSNRQVQQAFLLPWLLRLVTTCEKYLNPQDWIKNVNSIVSCPVMTCGEVIMDDLTSTERDIVMLNKLGNILFIKEIVSDYCDCKDEKIHFIVSQRLALLSQLVENFNKLFAVYGLPFVPVGMESYVKLPEKNNKAGKSIQIPPFEPGTISILMWENLHIVKSDQLLTILPIKDMHYSFMSINSLSMLLSDFLSWTSQLQTSSLRSRKNEQKEVFDRLIPLLKKELLASLSSLLILLHLIYVEGKEDLDGNANDEEFQTSVVFPLQSSILKIFTNLLSYSTYRQHLFETDLISITKSLCVGSIATRPSVFTLISSIENEPPEELTSFYAISQISSYIETFIEKITEIILFTSNASLNLTFLQFIETLVYFQTDMYLRLKGEKEAIHIENSKLRDSELMKNSILREEAKVKDLLYSLSDHALTVLKRDGFVNKPSSTVLKQYISYLIHVIIVYAKEQDSKLSTLIEAINQYNDYLYQQSILKDNGALPTPQKVFETLTKDSFHYYFSSSFVELVNVITSIQVEETLIVSDEDCQTMLERLKRLFTLLEVLVTVTKRNEKQTILSCTIKNFGTFMTFFLDRCWSFLTKLLSRFSSEVVFTVKIVQRCTRQIQSLCAHAKIVKDSSMLAYVPKIKKQLEQMIYIIKETLKKEGAEDAFWLGNLKNRYLNGKEVTEEGDKQLEERKRKRKTGNDDDGEEKRIKVKREVNRVPVEEEAMEVEKDETEESSECDDSDKSSSSSSSSDSEEN